jgi:hypothetical protein
MYWYRLQIKRDYKKNTYPREMFSRTHKFACRIVPSRKFKGARRDENDRRGQFEILQNEDVQFINVTCSFWSSEM